MANPFDQFDAPAKANPFDQFDQPSAAAPTAGPAKGQGASTAENFGMGVLRGAKDAVDTGAQWLASGFDKIAGTNEGGRVKAMNEAGRAEFDQGYGDNTAASIGRVGGQIAATLPVGGALGVGAKAVGAARLGDALATGGMRAGKLAADAGLGARAANMATRVGGGAATGGATAALVDPDAAATGAAIGAALPPALAAAGKAGRVVGSVIAPFAPGGKDKIAGRALNQFAADPVAAREALRKAPDLVPGSLPTTAAVSGDAGLAGLQRTVVNRDPARAAEFAERASTQNDARTRALEAMAGNRGKIAAAEEARDGATAAMREGALKRAGQVPAGALLGRIDQMIAAPDNAGLLVQRGLRQFRKQIAGNLKDGTIDGRALYAIRKDLNDVVGGKLQGESGNLRHASGQLTAVRGLIDDAIEAASNRVPLSGARQVGPAGGEAAQDAITSGQAGPSWREYLRTYSEMSRPINEMEALDKVLKRVQTGTMDTRGNAVLSAAKLNNILKNEGDELAKTLTPENLQILRNVQADLNAAVLASTAGKAVGSNTAQNIVANQMLSGVLGEKLAGTGVVGETVGRAVGFATKRASAAVEDRLGEAMLDPKTAALLMDLAQRPDLLQRLGQSRTAEVAVRSAPVAATNSGRN